MILRRKFSDLVLPGAIYDRAATWLSGNPSVKHDRETYTFRFPSGARLVFGHMQHEDDRKKYDGSEFQYIAFDEIQHFTRVMYTHLFTRLRAPVSMKHVLLRMRAAGMPDSSAIGFQWVRDHFVDPGTEGVEWVPALAGENPGLDLERYDESMSRLSEVKRLQLRYGRWDVSDDGGKFRREWFRVADDYPRGARLVRYWDRASRPVQEGKPDPDWTAGVLMAESEGQYWIVDIARTQSTPKGVEDLIKRTASIDGHTVPIWFEQERGSAGLSIVDHYARNVLPGYAVRGLYATGDIVLRADPLSAATELGNVTIVRGEWNRAFLDEASAFPFAAHDDQIDACSGAHHVLATALGVPRVETSQPRVASARSIARAY